MSYAKPYKEFFEASDAGTHYIGVLEAIISQLHDKAEKEPERARDYSQRAAGVKEALRHIRSTTAEGGKKNRTK